MRRLGWHWTAGAASRGGYVVVVLATLALAWATISVVRVDNAWAVSYCTPGAVAACAMINGCGGTKTCLAGKTPYWSPCTCAGGLQGGNACTSACNRAAGNVMCNATCTVILGCGNSSCTTCGGRGAGKVVCPLSGGATTCVGPEVCNGCDDDADGRADNVRGTKSVLSQACNPSACTSGGTQSCVGGRWATCTGCSGVGTCTVCGGAGTGTCAASTCVPATCTRAEQCNSCDDDGDGVLDDGLNCAKCNL